MERTFIILKPETIKRRLVGDIILRIERSGYTIESVKSLIPTKEILQKHYSEHINKSFYKSLESHLTSGMVICMIVSGKNAVQGCRKLIGETDPMKSMPGTIRGDYAVDIGRNIVHGADSVASAEKEIRIWFGDVKEERKLFDYELIYEN